MPNGVKPHDLLTSARDLVAASNRQSNLRRAQSTAYYAVFHAIAGCCADTFIGGPGSVRSRGAWRQAYRAVDHNQCDLACKHTKIGLFPKAVQDFANAFRMLLVKRHDADYAPDIRHYKSAVLLDIDQAELAIKDFEAAPIKDRRAFAALVVFKHR